MATWGSNTINIMHGTYRPEHLEAGIVEIRILPDLASTENPPSSVLQQSGRSRKRVRFDAYAFSINGYATLVPDYIAATERTFTDDFSDTFDAIIEYLSPPEYSQDHLIRFTVGLVEA